MSIGMLSTQKLGIKHDRGFNCSDVGILNLAMDILSKLKSTSGLVAMTELFSITLLAGGTIIW